MAIPPAIIIPLATEVIRGFFEYAKTSSQEKTKAKKIAADLHVKIRQIKAQEKVFLAYLDSAIDERKMLYKSVEEAIRHAILNQDHEMMKLCLEFKLSVYKQDVLKNTSNFGSIGSSDLEQLEKLS